MLLATSVQAQEPPKREFRGAWIATVINLDWPGSPFQSAQQQQDLLVALLDNLKESGINAVFFQIRSEGDALYASEIEPWSYYLTGEEGTAPDPYYDPLAFAIDEAHKRGMELHAWMNPYRADREVGGYERDTMHVTVQHPEWILEIGSLKLLNPGLPDVRDYNTRVIMDVVSRYDVDGIHFDDYFYPYPPNQIGNQDQATYQAHNDGGLSLADWRRDNINRFVTQVNDSIQAVKPHVKFGISPFGIWKNGVPSGITGLSAYDVIYGDALAWLADGSVDYLVPQLYWAFGGGQDFGTLAPWWAEQTSFYGRHLYTGHAVYRDNYSQEELPRQVRFARSTGGVQGSVFFRTRNLTANMHRFADSLRRDLYQYPALVPVMDWRETDPPNAPQNVAAAADAGVTITWDAPDEAADGDLAARYAVYRFSTDPTLPDDLTDARNLLAVTGETSHVDTPPASSTPYYYVVTALDHNSNESTPSNVAEAQVTTSAEAPTRFRFGLAPNYPNPFRTSTELRFTLDAPATVTLRIYNVIGQEVGVLLRAERLPAGEHRARWAPDDTLGSGVYFGVLEADTRRTTRTLLRVR